MQDRLFNNSPLLIKRKKADLSFKSKRTASYSSRSGSTITFLRITTRVLYDNDDIRAYLINKTELNRLR